MKSIHFGLTTVLLCSGPAWAAFPNGISSGDTTTDETTLWALTDTAGEVSFEVSAKPNFSAILASGSDLVVDVTRPAKLRLDGLVPGARHYYRVTDSAGDVMVGTFVTAAAAGEGRSLRFGVTGDWRGELAPYPAIANAARRNLDFFIKLGDTIYADYPSPAVDKPLAADLADYRAKHAEVYGERFGANFWADLQRQLSIFATIDDHEVVNDFAGGASAATENDVFEVDGLVNETARYDQGMQAFLEYNAIREETWTGAADACRFDGRPDLYRSQAFGDIAQIFILDARSFRNQELQPVADITNPAQIGLFILQSFDILPDPGYVPDALPTPCVPARPRTMLGHDQLERLKDDLLASQATWKFVMVPEPIQNLGALAASDRFEGYARERSEILGFIDAHGIDNVVFVAADIHGTLVNNLEYQDPAEVLQAFGSFGNPLAAPQHATSAFEITTGSVAFDAPFGPTVLDLADGVPAAPPCPLPAPATLLDCFLLGVSADLGFPVDRPAFDALPRAVKDAAVAGLLDSVITPLGYDQLGLEGSPVRARLTEGGWHSLFTFGWTEFQILPNTRKLKITTWGIDPYTEADVGPALLAREPELIGQFIVDPQ